MQLIPDTGPLSFFYLCFEISPGAESVLAKFRQAFDRIGFIHMGLDFVRQVEQLLIKAQSLHPLLKMSAQHQFLAMLYEIMRLVETPAMAEADRYTTGLIQYMHSIANQAFDLESAADRLGISKAHLIRVFKGQMGVPPLRYFNRLKMDTARDLLKRTDLTLAQISAQLSFCDEFYFSRVFKKYAGVSPDYYRRENTSRRGE